MSFFYYYCNDDYFSANNITDVNIFRNCRLFFFGIVIITLLRVILYIILLVIAEKKTCPTGGFCSATHGLLSNSVFQC